MLILRNALWQKARKWISLAKALVALLIIKIGLKVVSFNQFRKLFSSATNRRRYLVYSEQYVEDTVWSVKTVAHALPFSLHCLPQALAVKYLLRHELDLPLHIGVQQSASTGFEAHAWVERAGQIVIGEWPEGKTYRPLWVWP